MCREEGGSGSVWRVQSRLYTIERECVGGEGGGGHKGACVFLTVGNLRCPMFALLLGSPLFCVDPPQEAVSSVCGLPLTRTRISVKYAATKMVERLNVCVRGVRGRVCWY